MEPNDTRTLENSTAKPAGTQKALEIPVVKMTKTSTTKPKPVLNSDLDDELGHGLPSWCTESLIEIDEVRPSSFKEHHRPLWFRDSTTDAKYGSVAPFLQALIIPQNNSADVCFSNEPALCLRDMVHTYGKAAAVKKHRTITTAKDVCNKAI